MQNDDAVVPGIPSNSEFLIADWLVQPSLNIVSRGSVILHLEPKAMQVLVLLAEHPREVVPKQKLISTVWADTFVSEQVLTNAIWQIRQAFGDKGKDSQYVQTIPKSGYRLVASLTYPKKQVEAIETEAAQSVKSVAVSPDRAGHTRPLRHWKTALTVAVMLLVLVSATSVVVARRASGRNDSQKRIMIAVLPFQNLSGDPGQDYIGDGMMEEMILQLGLLHPDRLGVIARASALTYRNSGKRVDQIGRELGVDYILEGSIRQDDSKIRVTANLIDVASQRQLWGRSYEQDRKDILLMQSDIARSVAQQINLKVSPDESVEVSFLGTNNPEARDEYLQGLFFMSKFNSEDLQRGLAHFQRAAELDPTYAAPHVGMAEAYFILGQPLRRTARMSPRDYLATSKAEALHATELNPNSGAAHSLLAIGLFFSDWDWKGAEAEFRRALVLDPNLATTQIYYAMFLTLDGRALEAKPHIERALELDPLQLAFRTLAAELYFHARDYDRAYAEVGRVLEQDGRLDYAKAVLSGILLQTGREKEAATLFEKRLTDQGVPSAVIAKLRNSYVEGGMPAVYRFFLQDPRTGPGHDFHQALFYSRLNQKDAALASLEKAYTIHDSSLLFIRVHPVFDSLRDDQRFQDLQRRVTSHS